MTLAFADVGHAH